ncbi:hypothetical protein [Chryseobacterium cucumeris]|uniref:hypothetical protein n=1 Tax=Chryseobacterium cucumeris TaxID=1813611 RepID=UPI0037C16446
MKASGDTAGHEIAKGDEKEKQRQNAFKALEKAKAQEAQKQGRYLWNNEKRAYFFTVTNN